MKKEIEDIEDIKIPSYGGNPCHMDIKNLSEEEMDKLMATLLHGAYYAKGEKGRIVFIPAHEPLPDPVQDEGMLPFWRAVNIPSDQKAVPSSYKDFVHAENGYSSSITISGLCGFYYSPEFYRENAQRLESYGFGVMRSKRDNDFKYWEHWYLPSLWFAKGGLADSFKETKEDSEKLKLALEFLRTHVVFGSLDVSSQRLCMPNPD